MTQIAYETDESPEPDQDLTAADAPHGFVFGAGSALNAPTVEEFPAASQQEVDGLVWLGYLAEEVRLYGHRFTIKTLTRGERLAVAQVAREWEDTLGMADAYQAATVAAALLSVDDEPIAELDRAADRAQAIRATFGRVQTWYDPVVEGLFERVSRLDNRQLAAFQALAGK